MTNVRMKALDTLHISALSQHPFGPGDEFEINSSDAKSLEDRGLASLVVGDGGDGGDGGEKAAPPLENKMESAAENKAEPVAPVEAEAAPIAAAQIPAGRRNKGAKA